MGAALDNLLVEIRGCTLCEANLPLGPRPVLQASDRARILVVGQAPGRRVHETGIPFNDPSGDLLRQWMGLSREQFYDSDLLAIVPMGFCFPGTGKSGDLPPRPECAETWRTGLLKLMPQIEMTLAVGRYAIDWHLRPARGETLASVVRDYERHWPHTVPMPHPSPRNRRWLKQNAWFEAEIVPRVRQRIQKLISV